MDGFHLILLVEQKTFQCQNVIYETNIHWTVSFEEFKLLFVVKCCSGFHLRHLACVCLFFSQSNSFCFASPLKLSVLVSEMNRKNIVHFNIFGNCNIKNRYTAKRRREMKNTEQKLFAVVAETAVWFGYRLFK